MPTAGPRPDDALPDDEVVIRRIPSIHLRPREDGKREVSKGAFSASSKSRDPEEGMSVDRMAVLVAMGINPVDPSQFLPQMEVLMTFRVSQLHAHGLWVVQRPEPHPAQCNVLGVAGNKRKMLLGLAEFLRRPADVVKSGEQWRIMGRSLPCASAMPQDSAASSRIGVASMFDCVMPTRSGRHGLAFTRGGKVNLKNARHADDPAPLDARGSREEGRLSMVLDRQPR